MVDQDDPIKSWDLHLEKVDKVIKKLNNLEIESMTYTNSLGTNLTVYLPENYLFSSAKDSKVIVNMSSYEVFTSPIYNKTEGIVYSTMPLSYNGGLIEEFYLEFKNGKKKPSTKGQIPIYGGNGILDYTDQSNYDNENLIVGRVGAYCGCVYSHYGRCWVSDNAIVGKVLDGNDFYYCYYLLKRLNLNARHVGSGQPLMTQEILNSIEVNLPDYDTQKKIGKILKNIDDKIELNNEINNNLFYLSS